MNGVEHATVTRPDKQLVELGVAHSSLYKSSGNPLRISIYGLSQIRSIATLYTGCFLGVSPFWNLHK